MSRCDAGVRSGDAGRRLLRVLHRAVAGRREVGVALVLLLGEGFVGLIDWDRRLGRVDHRTLRFDRSLLAGDSRMRGRDIGVGLFERDFVVAVVDPGEDLTALTVSLSPTSTALK